MKTTDAGEVQRRRCQVTGTIVSIYHAATAGLDPAGGPWATICQDHGTICNHRTLDLARAHATTPEWCEPCWHF
jgi:hypothetical protein